MHCNYYEYNKCDCEMHCEKYEYNKVISVIVEKMLTNKFYWNEVVQISCQMHD